MRQMQGARLRSVLALRKQPGNAADAVPWCPGPQAALRCPECEAETGAAYKNASPMPNGSRQGRTPQAVPQYGRCKAGPGAAYKRCASLTPTPQMAESDAAGGATARQMQGARLRGVLTLRKQPGNAANAVPWSPQGPKARGKRRTFR